MVTTFLSRSAAGCHLGRRRAPAKSIPSTISASSAASIELDASRPSGEKLGRKRPFSRRFVHIANPLRSQYTMRTRSHRLEKKINRWPLSGSCRSTSRTSTIKLSGPLRPSTGWLATNRRTLGGRLSTNRPGPELRASGPMPQRRRTRARARPTRTPARSRTALRRHGPRAEPPTLGTWYARRSYTFSARSSAREVVPVGT